MGMEVFNTAAHQTVLLQNWVQYIMGFTARISFCLQNLLPAWFWPPLSSECKKLKMENKTGGNLNIFFSMTMLIIFFEKKNSLSDLKIRSEHELFLRDDE